MNNNRRRNFRTRPQKNNFRRRNGSINSNGGSSFKNNGKLSELAKCVMNDPIIVKYFKGFEEILNK